mgnify:CR=1 FL=1
MRPLLILSSVISVNIDVITKNEAKYLVESGLLSIFAAKR